jgi:CRISPR-associated Csh1 family protein
MIQSLYRLGAAMRTDPHYERYFASYADPFAGYVGEARVLVLPVVKGNVLEAELVNYNREQAGRYLYRKPRGSRGAPLVATGPFYPMTDLSNEKKREEHEVNVDKIMDRLERTVPSSPSVYFPDDETRARGLRQIENQLKQFAGQARVRYIYTLQIDGRWLGEIEQLRELLDQEAYAKYHDKSSAKNKTCALTGAQSVEVWGRVDTLGFTVNERAFNRGGFNDKHSYRMFPVSREAVKSLEAARRFVFNKLAARFYPLEYVIVPRLIKPDDELLLTLADTLTERDNTSRFDKQLEPLLGTDKTVEAAIGEGELQDGEALYDILFFQWKQAQLAITLYLQDLNPSHLLKLKTAQSRVQRRYGGPFATGKDGFQFSLVTLRNFFLQGSRNSIRIHPDFYRLLEGIFYGEPIREELLLSTVMDRVRTSFKNRSENDYMALDVMRGIASWQYLAELNLISPIQPTLMEQEPQTASMNIQEYLDEHGQYYDRSPALRGAFMVGVLTGMLTYAQYKSLNSKPFLNQLNSLNLSVEELRNLIPKLMEKIGQYQDRTATAKYLPYVVITNLMAEATDLLTQKGDKVSRDQASFAFVSGMVIQQRRGLQLATEAKARNEVAESAASTD